MSTSNSEHSAVRRLPRDESADQPVDGPVWLPQKRDLAEFQHVLQSWVRRNLDPEGLVTDVEIPGGGHASTETLMFAVVDGNDCERQELVLRVEPTDWQVFLENDLENQYLVMKVLGERSDVLVPRVRGFETDPGVIGSRFLVSERIRGFVPTEDPVVQPMTGSWLWNAGARYRSALWRSSVEALASVHAVNTSTLGLDRLHRGRYSGTGLEREFAYWRDFADWVGPAAHTPLLQLSWTWLVEHFPARSETALAWGDARIQNMIFDENFTVAAVIDWEMASMAGPLSDLGWWLVNERAMAEVVIDTPEEWKIEGFGTREETIALWEDLTRRKADGIIWYEVFAAWRLAVILCRLLPMLEPHGIIPDHGMTPADNTGTHDLARMFDRQDLLPRSAPPAPSPTVGRSE